METDHIVTADINFGKVPSIEMLQKIARRSGVALCGEIVINDETTIQAIINHGRWIVDCPWCSNAEYAREDRLFMCTNCWNGAIKREWATVILPLDRADIEAELVKRTAPENRNWTNGETVDYLKHENMEHGVE